MLRPVSMFRAACAISCDISSPTDSCRRLFILVVRAALRSARSLSQVSKRCPSAYIERVRTCSISGGSFMTLDSASPSLTPLPDTRIGFRLKNFAISLITIVPPSMLSARSGFNPGKCAVLSLLSPRSPEVIFLSRLNLMVVPCNLENAFLRVARSILARFRIVPPVPTKISVSCRLAIPDLLIWDCTCWRKALIPDRVGGSFFRNWLLTRSAPKFRVKMSCRVRF